MSASKPAHVVALSDDMRIAVLENLSDGVYFVDGQRRILYWNKGAERITGYSSEDVVGRLCKDNLLSHCDESGTVLCGSHCPLLNTIRDGTQREAHLYLRHKDGHRKPVRIRSAAIHDADGNVIGAVEMFHDDTALVDSKRRADDLQSESTSDLLTGAGNRRLGEATLAGWIEQYRHTNSPFGVLFVDVDRFKEVNDRFGHEVGDEALGIVARTLMETCRHGDMVVRWGGDEFLVLLAKATPMSLDLVASRLRVLMTKTQLRSHGDSVRLSISIGGTLAAPGDTAGLIVRRADELLYRGKNAGRNRVELDLKA